MPATLLSWLLGHDRELPPRRWGLLSEASTASRVGKKYTLGAVLLGVGQGQAQTEDARDEVVAVVQLLEEGQKGNHSMWC